jgi:hypothetical protein
VEVVNNVSELQHLGFGDLQFVTLRKHQVDEKATIFIDIDVSLIENSIFRVFSWINDVPIKSIFLPGM